MIGMYKIFIRVLISSASKMFSFIVPVRSQKSSILLVHYVVGYLIVTNICFKEEKVLLGMILIWSYYFNDCN